jgi:NDP-sugar pyrophosphorylase family protein
MQKILICPGERAAMGFLSQSVPLVTLPILGADLLTYWVECLAMNGIKEVIVFATDRPDLVRSSVGDGARWGMRIDVRTELNELTAAEASAKVANERQHPIDPLKDVFTIDHLPGFEQIPMLRSYRDWFAGVLAWMPWPAKLNRIGLREVKPGIWCARRVHVSSTAKLEAPCWLGESVQIGPEAVIGPDAVLEEGVVIDAASEIRASAIGPDTFIGSLARIESSIAWGNTLIDWRTGSCTQVPDAFLMCALGQRHTPDWAKRGRGWLRNAVSTLWRRGCAAEADPRTDSR